ncbi:MAG: efflux transporter outer membrane subunit, partial [Desulfamplus sp.]|nr:efflux transporter outer membrane subunit [Desulfamplus sp.]
MTIFLQTTKINIHNIYHKRTLAGHCSVSLFCNSIDSAEVQTIGPLPLSRLCNPAYIFLFIVLFLSSCTSIVPKPENLQKNLSIPDSYYSKENSSYRDSTFREPTFRESTFYSIENSRQHNNHVEKRWWESFGNNELTSLVDKALGENFSLREAWARLEQAKAVERSQKSETLPSINFDISVARRESGRSTSSYNTLSAGPGASYEVDLWGNIKARIVEYEHKTLAARFDLEAAAMSVAAQIANDWVELITVREQISLVKKQVEINTMLLDLLELRFQNSMSSALDVLQQREMVAKSRARIPPLEIRQASLLNAISLLCGRASPKEISINTSNLNDIPSMPKMGIPVDLLSNRPDIQSAGFRLSSSQWAMFQARTDRLPSLNLTGSFLFQHTSLDAILKNWVVVLASRLGGTLFDGGKNRAAVDLASAVVEERLAAYEKTVFTAILEVENAIVAEKYRTRWIDLMKAELDAANLALEEARNRYSNGMDTFIPVVTEQLNV